MIYVLCDPIYDKWSGKITLQRHKSVWLPGDWVQGVTAIEHGRSFGDNGNVLKLDCDDSSATL